MIIAENEVGIVGNVISALSALILPVATRYALKVRTYVFTLFANFDKAIAFVELFNGRLKKIDDALETASHARTFEDLKLAFASLKTEIGSIQVAAEAVIHETKEIKL